MAEKEIAADKLLPAKPYGAVHGRFQGLHLDHEEYILRAMSCCAYLFVGIVTAGNIRSKNQASPAHRFEPNNNPFSYYERSQLVRGCLIGAGYGENDFTTHPFPIDQPNLIPNYLPLPN